ncbi:MAG: hypothetical protein H6601_06650 [Flavobacteriales bacterium]|nr:hypothetical protein [Flavobacteriales bacterium]
MKAKLLNLVLILTSLIGYLEWGGGNSTFLVQGEWDVLAKLFINPTSAAHPFTLLPLVGQLLLVITLFQKKPSAWLTYLGMGGIGLLLLLMFVIGLMGLNFKILLSTVPFLMVCVGVVVNRRYEDN